MPSDHGLSARVLDKLNQVAAGKDDAWKLLVLASLEGDEALAEALAADPGAKRGKAAAAGKGKGRASAEPSSPRLAHLRGRTVGGLPARGQPGPLRLPP